MRVRGTRKALAVGALGAAVVASLVMPASAAPGDDTTPPVITLVSRTAANANGWNNTDVVIEWSCVDEEGGSGIVDATVTATVTDEGAGQSSTGTCADNDGNTASDTQLDINIDKTAPTISGSASPAPNASGWITEDVDVTFSCDDTGGSGIDTCEGDTTIAADGEDQSVLGTATDLAGNTADATVEDIDRDATNPDVIGTMSRSPDHPSGFYTSPVTITFGGTDATSGLDAASCTSTNYAGPDSAEAFAIGACSDNAGNQGVVAKGFKYDGSSPGATVDSNVNNPFAPTGFAAAGGDITGRATDAGSGVVRVEVTLTPLQRVPAQTLEAVVASPGSTNTAWSVDTSLMVPGFYQVQATAVDGVGRRGPVSVAAFWFVTSGP